jgi:hypothetical protein
MRLSLSGGVSAGLVERKGVSGWGPWVGCSNPLIFRVNHIGSLHLPYVYFRH